MDAPVLTVATGWPSKAGRVLCTGAVLGEAVDVVYASQIEGLAERINATELVTVYRPRKDGAAVAVLDGKRYSTPMPPAPAARRMLRGGV